MYKRQVDIDGCVPQQQEGESGVDAALAPPSWYHPDTMALFLSVQVGQTCNGHLIVRDKHLDVGESSFKNLTKLLAVMILLGKIAVKIVQLRDRCNKVLCIA